MDDSSSGRTSLADSSSLANSSIQSGTSSQNINSDGLIHVYNYLKGDFEKFSPTLHCEEICTSICRHMDILPPAQLLFGLRKHTSNYSSAANADVQHKWVLPCEHLQCNQRYCFRMRFKVPELDRQLQMIDVHSHRYLYYQMRYDMLHEHITEIRYPDHKDKVMGLAVMDMLIDKEEQQQTPQNIEKAYKNYLPRSLWLAHRIFVKHKIRSAFRKLSNNLSNVDNLMWHYVHQIYHLAPTYLTEQFKAKVENLPNEHIPNLIGGMAGGSITSSTRTSTTTLITGSNSTLSTTTTNGHHQQHNDSNSDTQTLRQRRRRLQQQQELQARADNYIPVYVKLSFHDSPEPGVKVARVTSEATLKWTLVTVLEDITTLYIESEKIVRLETRSAPKGYRMRFDCEHEMKAFISYLCIYTRLTVTWMQDLCCSYRTPSLDELKRLYCHGPIGGSYSLMKLHKNGECGSYIVRQCDREYYTYYIDINTKVLHERRVQTETFKITRKDKQQWKLSYNGDEYGFDQLPELAQSIRTDSEVRLRIPASKYDKPPMLLLCLPKNMKSKKTDTELSEAELQRRNPQIFNPKTDFNWYKENANNSDDNKMITMRADWIQQGSIKDVPVTMKLLKYDANFQNFIELAQNWSLIQSPQFIKLYGLTLSVPYTMVMEYSKYGPLNKFLSARRDISMHCLLDVMLGLVRGMHYLEDNKIFHSYIRCANLYVTKYNPTTYELDAKISDPGFPRPYKLSDSPWIPVQYYKNLEAAKKDLSTQMWAFATTVWEIFSRGHPSLEQLEQRDLIRNRTQDGGILKPLDSRLCPPEMYETIMDGWSDDPDKRFSHHVIFTRLNAIKTRLERNYVDFDNETDIFDEEDTYNSDQSLNCVDNGESSVAVSEIFRNFQERRLVLQLDDCKVIYREKDQIGRGHYGIVYRGELVFNDRERNNEKVAIKKLIAVQVPNDFLREINIMRTLDHPNVVKFKYWAEKSLSIIMEYFEHGSFNVHLSTRKPDLKNPLLLKYALDIAHGMNYLSGKGLIHRDLAARNILVDNDCVKISDFGLAQFANEDGYYYGTSQRDIPIKWYSPEAIETCKFSSYSDVWSYGVTLFEMFSRGEVPNLLPGRELTQEEFLNRLRKGERLPKPKECPDFVYNELMLACWHETPKSRPTFSEIIRIIQNETGHVTKAGTGNLQQQQQQQQQQLIQNHAQQQSQQQQQQQIQKTTISTLENE